MNNLTQLICIGIFVLCVGFSFIIGIRAVVKYFFPSDGYNPRN